LLPRGPNVPSAPKAPRHTVPTSSASPRGSPADPRVLGAVPPGCSSLRQTVPTAPPALLSPALPSGHPDTGRTPAAPLRTLCATQFSLGTKRGSPTPAPRPTLPAAWRHTGCCFSSNSPSIGERRGAGAGGSGGSGAAGPGPRAGGRALVWPRSPGAVKALIFLIAPCSNFPSSPAVEALAACRGSAARPAAFGPAPTLKETNSYRRPGPRLCRGQGAACCPAMPTRLPPIRPSIHPSIHPSLHQPESCAGRGGGGRVSSEPPLLPWGQWEKGSASHWVHSPRVVSRGRRCARPQQTHSASVVSLLTLKPNDCVPNTSHHLTSEKNRQRCRGGHSLLCTSTRGVLKKDPWNRGLRPGEAPGERGEGCCCARKIKGAKTSSCELFGWAEHRSPPSRRAQRGTGKNRRTCSTAPLPPSTHFCRAHRAGLGARTIAVRPIRARPVGLSHVSPPGTGAQQGAGVGSPCAPRLTPPPAPPSPSPREAPRPARPGWERGR